MIHRGTPGECALAEAVRTKPKRIAPSPAGRDDLVARISIAEGASLREAMEAIDRGAVEMALAVDGSGRLAGLVTDGDVRRAILHGCTLESPVADVLNRRPLSLAESASRDEILAAMGRHGVRQLPLVDQDGRVRRIAWITDLIRADLKPNHAVIMAGGRGTRLWPLTKDVPKPMLEVQGCPILEHIIRTLREYGVFRITISVNHLREVIVEYFGRGERFGVQIDYIQEDRPLGTAGALALLEDKPAHPLIVMNGDLLQRVNLDSLLAFHDRGQFQATMSCVRRTVELPFGVVEVQGSELVGLTEKPTQTLNINAGIYVLNPGVLDYLTPNECCDMTELITRLLAASKKVGVFTLLGHEGWLDIGQKDDYEHARANGNLDAQAD